MQSMDGPMACGESELDETISLINSIFRAGTDQDIRSDYPLVFNASARKYMRIVRVDGRVVSHVPVAPREVVADGDRFITAVISPTATHPDYRHRGYATLCLRDCVRIMEEKGWPVSVLWTREATFPFYQNSGWEAVGPQAWAYTLRPQEHTLFQAGAYDIVAYNPANTRHLDAVIRLHDSEPHRIARSREEYRALLELPKMSTFLAMTGEDVAAYLIAGRATNKPGLIEGGGDGGGLEALVRHALLVWCSDATTQGDRPAHPDGPGPPPGGQEAADRKACGGGGRRRLSDDAGEQPARPSGAYHGPPPTAGGRAAR